MKSLGRCRCVRFAWLFLIGFVVCVPFVYFKASNPYDSGDRLEKIREDIKRRRMMRNVEIEQQEEPVKEFEPFEGLDCIPLQRDEEDDGEFAFDARMLPKPGGCIVKMRVIELHPTQLAVGNKMVEQKREKVKRKLRKKPEKIEEFLRRHTIPAIKAPNGNLYIIDHHHLSFALVQAGVEEAYVNVIEDWSDQTKMEEFWDKMEERQYLWTYDEHGNKIDRSTLLARLPDNVTGLKNDPYRDLAAFARLAGAYQKDWTPFSEFLWANYFRDKVKMTHQVVNHPPYIEAAVTAARHPDAAHLPGHIPG